MPQSVAPSTFNSIPLNAQASSEMPFAELVKTLLEKLEHLKDQRSAFYEVLRRSNTKWANGSRWVLAMLGSIAFLLTGLAAALRFIWDDSAADKVVLVVVLAIYAVMGAISFYERGTGKTTAYFRQVGVILALRDLWT
ncbi:MAG: hypothetical protein ACRD2A_08275, partial [Vicinamibacterales bacterium]